MVIGVYAPPVHPPIMCDCTKLGWIWLRRFAAALPWLRPPVLRLCGPVARPRFHKSRQDRVFKAGIGAGRHGHKRGKLAGELRLVVIFSVHRPVRLDDWSSMKLRRERIKRCRRSSNLGVKPK